MQGVRHGTTEAIVTTSNGEAPSTTNAPSTAVVKVVKEGLGVVLRACVARGVPRSGSVVRLRGVTTRLRCGHPLYVNLRYGRLWSGDL